LYVQDCGWTRKSVAWMTGGVSFAMLSMNVTREDTITAIRRVLQQYAAVRLGLLFGSIARGTANERSDIDIAIDIHGSADRLRIAAQLSAALGVEIDLVLLGDAGVPLLDEIVRDGVVVYEATPHAAARWRTRALIDLETDRPWYGRMRDAWLARVAAQGLNDGQP
jgi:predicted nucleotidyltransferase